MNGFRNAVVFLTRIPIGLGSRGTDLTGAVAWFPVVGALIGLFGGVLAALLLEVMPPLVAASLTIAALALVTGAFHSDGLADVADAFPGGTTVERRIEILGDSRLGTYGVMALVLVVAVQISSLAALSPRQALAALVAAHALGRSAAVVSMATVPPAKGSGLGVSYVGSLRPWTIGWGIAVGPIVALVAVGPWAGAMIGAASFAPAALGWLALRKIGGIVGDVLGAVEQVAETSVLVVAATLAHEGSDWPWWS